MTEDQLETWMHNMIRACNRSTCDSDINAIKLIQHIKTIYEQGRTDEREACAKVCESIDAEYEGEDVLATWCTKAIRARCEK